MMRVQRRARVGGAAMLVAAMTGGIAGTADAAPAALQCGQRITKPAKLTADIGPCPGDGLIIAADNVMLNLNGHTVTGLVGGVEKSGILFDGVTGSTVRNGTVRNFDAGVTIQGGRRNTVDKLLVRDNIHHDLITGAEDECNLGDGITVVDSSENRIWDNEVTNNGPYSGISLVGNSDNNKVNRNNVHDNDVTNISPITGETAPCGAPFSRPVQNIGIRIEGPGADGNEVVRNRVVNSAIGGITIHGYIYAPPNGGPSQSPNTGNLIQANYVAETGRTTHTIDPLADGIAVLRQGPARVVSVSQGNTIDNNTVVDNFRHGVFLGNPTDPGPKPGNVVTGNTVLRNAVDGFRVANGSVNNTLSGNNGHNNVEHDAHDANPACDNNAWTNNSFGTVNQPCVSPAATVIP